MTAEVFQFFDFKYMLYVLIELQFSTEWNNPDHGLRGTLTWESYVGLLRGTLTWDSYVGILRGTLTWESYVGISNHWSTTSRMIDINID